MYPASIFNTFAWQKKTAGLRDHSIADAKQFMSDYLVVFAQKQKFIVNSFSWRRPLTWFLSCCNIVVNCSKVEWAWKINSNSALTTKRKKIEFGEVKKLSWNRNTACRNLSGIEYGGLKQVDVICYVKNTKNRSSANHSFINVVHYNYISKHRKKIKTIIVAQQQFTDALK